MPYPTLPGRRFEYDAGGGSVYYGNDINEIGKGPNRISHGLKRIKRSFRFDNIRISHKYLSNRWLWLVPGEGCNLHQERLNYINCQTGSTVNRQQNGTPESRKHEPPCDRKPGKG